MLIADEKYVKVILNVAHTKEVVLVTGGEWSSSTMRNCIAQQLPDDRAISFVLFTSLFYNWDDTVDIARNLAVYIDYTPENLAHAGI